MTHLEIKQATAQKLEDLSQQAQKSVDEMLEWLLNNCGQALIASDEEVFENANTWSDDELQQLLKQKQPLTGKQIVEKHLKTGVIGSWADMGIEDSAEWVNQQKSQRRNKHQW